MFRFCDWLVKMNTSCLSVTETWLPETAWWALTT